MLYLYLVLDNKINVKKKQLVLFFTFYATLLNKDVLQKVNVI